MMDRDTDGLAAEYALGTLAGKERDRFVEDMAHDPALEKLVSDWEQRLAPLSENIAPMNPPAGLWDKIEAEVDVLASPGAKATNIRVGEGDWIQRFDGVDKKILFTDPVAGTESYLLRLAPGAWIPAHEHLMSEQCLMIEGDVTIGDTHLTAGDFHAIPPGTPHPAVVSEGGALAFIVGEIRKDFG